MKRPLKWLLPVLVLCELGLVWFDVLDLGDAPTTWKKRDCGCATVPLQKGLSSTPT